MSEAGVIRTSNYVEGKKRPFGIIRYEYSYQMNAKYHQSSRKNTRFSGVRSPSLAPTTTLADRHHRERFQPKREITARGMLLWFFPMIRTQITQNRIFCKTKLSYLKTKLLPWETNRPPQLKVSLVATTTRLLLERMRLPKAGEDVNPPPRKSPIRLS